MNKVSSVVLPCNEPAPPWLCAAGIPCQGLVTGSHAAARWLVSRYPNPRAVIPVQVSNSPQLLALSMGALLCGRQLLFMPQREPPAQQQARYHWLCRNLKLAFPIQDDDLAAKFDHGIIEKFSDWPEPEEPAYGNWTVFGSGSSGGQRAVHLGRQQLSHAAAAQSQHLAMGPEQRWLLCLPLDHIGGLMAGLRAAWAGCTIALHPTFNAQAVSNDLAHCQGLSLVPTMAWRILQLPDSSFTHQPIALIGGAACAQDLVDGLMTRGIRPLRCWGATETAAMMSCQSLAQCGAEHCGKILGGGEFFISEGRQLLVRGKNIAHHGHDENGPLAICDDKGWLHSGDCAKCDDDGNLIILGRSDGAIHSGGITVFPEAVELLLSSNPWHYPCAVIGFDDPQWGQCLTAAVACADAQDLTRFQQWCEAHCAAAQRPKKYVRYASLPLLRNGKIDRQRIIRNSQQD